MPIDEPLTPPYALIWPSEDSGENDPRSSLTGPSISFLHVRSFVMAGGRVIGTTPLGLQKTNPSPLHRSNRDLLTEPSTMTAPLKVALRELESGVDPAS